MNTETVSPAITKEQSERLTDLYNAVCDCYGAGLEADKIRDEVKAAINDAEANNT